MNKKKGNISFHFMQKLQRYSSYLLWGLIICASSLYISLSFIHHTHYQSGGFDLGIYDQAVWQYAHFLYPFNTIKERMILGDHFTLSLPLLAPLYWIWDSVFMLLAFQAIFVSLSALAVYKYTQKRGFSSFESLILSILYLFFYGTQFGLFFDFHPVMIGVGLLAWILYFWESEQWRWFYSFIALLLLTQENMGLALFAVCIIWFFQKKHRRLVILLAAIGLLWTYISFRLIPLFSPTGSDYVPQLPSSVLQALSQLGDHEEKRQVWLYSLSWYSFLPLFSPGAMLAVVSDLAQYFLTGPAFQRMWSPFMHHRAILSLYLLVGTTDVLLFLKKKHISSTVVVMFMLIFALFLNYHFHFALNKLSKREFVQQEAWMKDNDRMLLHVPQKVSVAAQQSLVPHLSHRTNISLIYPRIEKSADILRICGKNPCWWLDFFGKPEYLVVDVHEGVWLTMTLASQEQFMQALTNMERAKVITLFYQQGQARIYSIKKQRPY